MRDPERTAFKVWAEWDIGQDEVVFMTRQRAWEWCQENPSLLEIVEEDAAYESVFDIYAAGLVGINELELDP